MSQDAEGPSAVQVLGMQVIAAVPELMEQWEDAWSSACEGEDNEIVPRAFLLPAADKWRPVACVLDGIKELSSVSGGIPDLPGTVPVLFVEGIERPTIAFSYTAESIRAMTVDALEERDMEIPESLMPAQE